MPEHVVILSVACVCEVYVDLEPVLQNQGLRQDFLAAF